MLDEAAIYGALERVVDPCSIATGAPITLREMGMIEAIDIDGGAVRVTLRLTSPVCWQAANIIAMVEKAVGALPEVDSVDCALNGRAQWVPDMMHPDATARLRRLRPLPEARP
ncbi:metal-sulfur cluster assembly factor [Ensifer sp. ENS12]|uniref:metal-sulfur cluster assembly factor n=1 Tax=Ensifer sp. ENS12 TaxID=2854774 RepID=UPI001C44A599|nr:iron-sulfur cluster assembly protein [Ensifer sp. ENS12]MBV7520509.1 iron-sulfur cluster assembly protein [Ensifer sp. ENS12]